MEVLDIKELENGNCELDCEFTDNEISLLLNYAVNKILKEQLEEVANDVKMGE